MLDATTLHSSGLMLERHQLAEQLFAKVGRVLQGVGMTMIGTIVDATIISAPSSSKNREKLRDLEMDQTRNGKQGYFGMKLCIDVDSQSEPVPSAMVISANMHSLHCRTCCMDRKSGATATARTPARRSWRQQSTMGTRSH